MNEDTSGELRVRALRAVLQSRSRLRVQLKETHISWLLLTPRRVYKLKKPVRLPFLDFSTIALRQHFCEEELRLNRRLAPSLYLRVVAVCGSDTAPRIGGAGQPIDYAVCMRRFPPGALWSEMLASGRLRPVHIDRWAGRLADFHRDAPVARPPAGQDTVSLPEHPVFAVMRQLGTGGRSLPWRCWLEARADELTPVWAARRSGGAVRECHGDLHLDNIVVLGRDVTAFDCMEFDPALRWIDVMSDVAFVCMDLQARGRADMAWRFLDTYLQRSGDFAGLRVLRFEAVYRALVRSLVAGLRQQQEAGASAPEQAPDYLACVQQLVDQAAVRGRLLITCGVSGSGKSRLAGQLLEMAGAVRLRSDVERKRLFGLDALQPGAGELYSPEASAATFEQLADQARNALLAGYPVIVDAAFLKRAQRRAFRALAAELGVPFSILHCEADEQVLRQRVASRRAAGTDASDATLAVLATQLSDHEPLDTAERAVTMAVRTDLHLDRQALCTRWLAAT